MMTLREQERLCGIAIAWLSGFCGLFTAFLLSNHGLVEGTKLTDGMIYLALGAATLFPILTVRFLPAPWWVAPLVFCASIALSLPLRFFDHDTLRFFTALCCITLAVGGAWLFRPRHHSHH